MRIGDWSSDVCSSDLSWVCKPSSKMSSPRYRNVQLIPRTTRRDESMVTASRLRQGAAAAGYPVTSAPFDRYLTSGLLDRQSLVSGKSVAVRVDYVGSLFQTQKRRTPMHTRTST